MLKDCLEVLTAVIGVVTFYLEYLCCCKLHEKKSAAKKIPDAIKEMPKLNMKKINEETKEI
jgi:hypothetical protein